MPVIFAAHGAPVLLDDPVWMGELAAWADAMPKPKSILMVSAHWEERPATLGATRTVPLVHDFYGFPQRYYQTSYPAPGAPDLAARVRALLRQKGIPSTDDPERGLDHGAYVPLVAMYPEADVPVLQVSMPGLDAEALLELGRAIAPLREEGVLVFGSGFRRSFMTELAGFVARVSTVLPRSTWRVRERRLGENAEVEVKMTRRRAASCLILVSLLPLQGCATLGEIARTMTNLKRLQFRLEGIGDPSLAGISLAGKSEITDFSIADGVELLAAFRSRRLPARFLLDVGARNPNDGTGGSARTTSTLTRFDWRLLIDERPTVSGGIERPLEIPGTGQSTTIPLRVEVDLYEFFGHRGYDDLLDLALALGGRNADISRVALDARPSVSTPLGEIAYPERITIVSREFR
jgi:hypothetical protein